METQPAKTVHEGRNVKRLREFFGIKQEALAMELGISQQAISALEQKEALDKDMLEKIAKVLKVSPEVIRNFNEEAAFNIIGNTVHNHDNGAFLNYYPTFNPLDKLMEALDENKKLYERLLQVEREKNEILQGLIKG